MVGREGRLVRYWSVGGLRRLGMENEDEGMVKNSQTDLALRSLVREEAWYIYIYMYNNIGLGGIMKKVIRI